MHVDLRKAVDPTYFVNHTSRAILTIEQCLSNKSERVIEATSKLLWHKWQLKTTTPNDVYTTLLSNCIETVPLIKVIKASKTCKVSLDFEPLLADISDTDTLLSLLTEINDPDLSKKIFSGRRTALLTALKEKIDEFTLETAMTPLYEKAMQS